MRSLIIFLMISFLTSSSLAQDHDTHHHLLKSLKKKNSLSQQKLKGRITNFGSCIIYKMQGWTDIISTKKRYAFIYDPKKQRLILYRYNPGHPTCEFDAIMVISQLNETEVLAEKHATCYESITHQAWFYLFECKRTNFTGIQWY